MALFARLDENNIVNLILFVNDFEILNSDGNVDENLGVSLCQNLIGDSISNWKMSSIDSSSDYRVRPARIGFTYNANYDAFIPPKPYLNWIFDDKMMNWTPPIQYSGNIFTVGFKNDPPPTPPYVIWDDENVCWEERL